ncbi:MAG: hypothetical protein ING19_20720 [Azospirillum sp.]|nr:hypothetical protein [Azospirillum sp.]MCA3268475.1 hypothetical protein [Azospirillum sp.]
MTVTIQLVGFAFERGPIPHGQAQEIAATFEIASEAPAMRNTLTVRWHAPREETNLVTRAHYELRGHLAALHRQADTWKLEHTSEPKDRSTKPEQSQAGTRPSPNP